MRAAILLAVAACAQTPRTVAMISANAEWQPVVARLHEPVHAAPYGEWLEHRAGLV